MSRFLRESKPPVLKPRIAIIVSLLAVIGCGGDGVTGTHATPGPKSVVISPSSLTMFSGDSARLSATVIDSNNKVISGATVHWSSVDSTHVAVDSLGWVRVVLGPTFSGATPVATVIRASYGQLRGEAQVAVPYRPAFNIFPSANVLYAGMTRQLTARLVSSGSQYDTATAVTPSSWQTSDASVVTVTNGLLAAVGAGQAQITASVSDGRTATSIVTVLPTIAQPLRFVAASGGPAVVIKTIDANYDGRDCGLTADGSVYCWGAAASWMAATDLCEMGVRTVPSTGHFKTWKCSELPQLMPSPVKFSSITIRGEEGCGVALNGRVYCWGANRSGVLGIGSPDTTARDVTPIASTDSFVNVQLSAVIGTACALRADGAEFCWGGTYGNAPVAIAGGLTFKAIAETGGCGLAVDNAVYCFTSGTGQRAGGSGPWTAVTQGPCALDANAQPFCGLNGSAPFAISGAPGFTRLGIFLLFLAREVPQACGLTAGGDLYCFDSFSGATATKINTGVTVKSFSGSCLVGTDDKIYCVRYDIASHGFALSKVPGQQ